MDENPPLPVCWSSSWRLRPVVPVQVHSEPGVDYDPEFETPEPDTEPLPGPGNPDLADVFHLED